MEQANILDFLYQEAYNAHRGTSQVPEDRAKSMIASYGSELMEDLATIADEEQRERYKKNYIQKLRNWMGAKSRCLSVLVTGPANFPNSRNAKANNSERNRCNEFRDWRDRALTAIKKAENKKDNQPLSDKPSEFFQLGLVSIAYNYAIDRVQILFPDVPPLEVRERLKKKAFKWSPKNKAWQRKLTENGKSAAKEVVTEIETAA